MKLPKFQTTGKLAVASLDDWELEELKKIKKHAKHTSRRAKSEEEQEDESAD